MIHDESTSYAFRAFRGCPMGTTRGDQSVSNSVVGPPAVDAACPADASPVPHHRYRARSPPCLHVRRSKHKDGAADAPTSTAPETSTRPVKRF
jgi:hypothetical protein